MEEQKIDVIQGGPYHNLRYEESNSNEGQYRLQITEDSKEHLDMFTGDSYYLDKEETEFDKTTSRKSTKEIQTQTTPKTKTNFKR